MVDPAGQQVAHGRHDAVSQLRVLIAASLDQRLTRVDLAVLAFVLKSINGKTGIAFPSLTTIATATKANRRTATRSIASLVDVGYLIRESGNREAANTYRMGSGSGADTSTPRGTQTPTRSGVDAPTPRGADTPTVGANNVMGVGVCTPLQSTEEQSTKSVPTEEPALTSDGMAVVWRTAIDMLAKQGKQEGTARSLLGKIRKNLHNDDRAFAGLITDAKRENPIDLVSWLTKAAQNSVRRNGKTQTPLYSPTEFEADAQDAKSLARYLGATP